MRKKYRVKEHQLYTVKRSIWRKLLKENKIDPIYRYRSRKIGLVTSLLSPLYACQSWLFRKRVLAVHFINNAPVFIIGHWRSGTTHLHYMMARDPQFGYLNNHQAFTNNFSLLSLNKLNKILNVFVPGKRPQDNVRLSLDEPAEEEQPFSTMSSRASILSFFFPRNQSYFRKYHLFDGISPEEKEHWQRDYMHLLQTISFYNKNSRLVLKNPHNTGRIKELLELFPDAKFVFLHRDPFTVFQSTYHMYKKMVSTQFLQFVSLKEIREIILNNFKEVLRKYLKERELIPPGNLVEIAFTDLEGKPYETLQFIYKNLGLSGFEQAKPSIQSYLTSVENYKKNRFPSLSPDLETVIRKEWDFFFDAFNYAEKVNVLDNRA